MFVSYLLLAYYTLKILDIYRINLYLSLLMLGFVLTNPVLIFRAMHPALFGHWILVAGIYFYLLKPNLNQVHWKNIQLSSLIVFSALINPYLFAMVFGFSIIVPIKQAFFDKTLNPKKIILYPAFIILIVVSFWYIIGFIRFGSAVNMNVGNSYGIYGLNLNSLVNSFGFSSYLPSLNKVSDYQYEGYMYMGLGMLILMFFSVVYRLYSSFKHRKPMQDGRKYLPLLILSILLSLFAMTGTITFGKNILFEINLPKIVMQLGEIFRASARFFWLSYYLIFFATFIYFTRSAFPLNLKYILLSILIIVQFYDIKPILTFRNLEYGSYKTPLDEEKWDAIFKQFDVICTYPPFENHLLSNMDYQDIDYLALKERKPITNGYVARDNALESQKFKNGLELELLSEINPEYLFITTANHLESFRTQFVKNTINITFIDRYYFIYSKNKHLPQQLLDENNHISDSIRRIYSEQSNFQECKPWSLVDSNLVYNFETIYSNDMVLKASGWAFFENANNTQFDSLFVALSNDEKCYIYPINKALRPDVNAHFKRSDLENSGFNFLILSDSLVNQVLQIGFAFKSKGNVITYCPTHKLINDEQIPKLTTALINNNSNVNFNLEKVLKENTSIEISGWAYIPKQNSAENTIKVLFIKDNQIFEIETEKIYREDVSQAFGSGFNLNASGFKIKFRANSIPSGIYQIGIAIFDLDSQKYLIIVTNKILENHN
ncbi:MAG TPA: hypothetical protein DCG69_05795 [Bacteroidales bacterium]|nr:hypothetical protein [Bacteroidales bacterium]